MHDRPARFTNALWASYDSSSCARARTCVCFWPRSPTQNVAQQARDSVKCSVELRNILFQNIPNSFFHKEENANMTLLRITYIEETSSFSGAYQTD